MDVNIIKGVISMNEQEQIAFLKQMAKGLAVQFGSQCEVVVHDLTGGSEKTIVAIENGHVTGRRIGDGASKIVLQALNNPEVPAEDRYGYHTRTQDGRLLRSSSIYLKDEDGDVIALLGINYDYTELTQAARVLNQFTVGSEDQQSGIETIFSNVVEMLERLINESVDYVGKPVALMSKEDKVKAVRFLEEKGAFLIRSSSDKVAEFFDISKYTLYNYLNLKARDSDSVNKKETEVNE
jgi:predicted transcriptional regulator YheO